MHLIQNLHLVARDIASQVIADLGSSELNKTDVFPEG